MTYASRRDKNEAEIIKFIRGVGGHVIQMDRQAGFDLLVLWRGTPLIVEVKNPEQSWKYTPNEEATRAACEYRNVQYWTIETLHDVVRMLGVTL